MKSNLNSTAIIHKIITCYSWIQSSFSSSITSWCSKQKKKTRINYINKEKSQLYALDETRPPRLNFFPFNTLAGTIGADGCIGTDGIGDDVVA